MAGVVPSPSRYNALGHTTARQGNPVYGQIMNYQLGRQTNQSNERNVQTQEMARALTALLNNPGNQGMVGAVNQAQMLQEMMRQGGGGFGAGFNNINLSPVHPMKAQAEMQRAQRMGTAQTQAAAGNTSRAFGQVPTNEGYMRPMDEKEALASILTNMSARKGGSGSGYEQQHKQQNKVETTQPTMTPDGGYALQKSTDMTENKTKTTMNPRAQQAIDAIIQRQPTIGDALADGRLTAEDDGAGTITILMQGTPVTTVPY